MNVLGYSDQRYIFADGSQALPEAIAASLPAGSILLERRLAGDRGGMPSGIVRAAFRSSADATETVYADRVVLAIPFIALRGARSTRAPDSTPPRSTRSRISATAITRSCTCSSTGARGCARTSVARSRRRDRFGRRCPCRARSIIRSANAARDGLIEVFTAGRPGDARHAADAVRAHRQTREAVRRHVRRFFEQLDRIWPGVSRPGTARRRSATRRPIRTFSRATRAG